MRTMLFSTFLPMKIGRNKAKTEKKYPESIAQKNGIVKSFCEKIKKILVT